MTVPRRNRRTDDATAARDRYRAAIVANGGRFDRAAWVRFTSETDAARAVDDIYAALADIANN